MKSTPKIDKDCGADCDCHNDQLTHLGRNVWTNENGGSGPSERMKRLLKMKEERANKTK